MINRPPTPEECIPVLCWTDWSDKERDAMQEALTAEWLIGQGFMPDPSWAEKEGYFDLGYYDKDAREWVTEFGEWTCEDKTQ